MASLIRVAKLTAKTPTPRAVLSSLRAIRRVDAYLHLFPKEQRPSRLLNQLADISHAASRLRKTYAHLFILGSLHQGGGLRGLYQMESHLGRRAEKRQAELPRVIEVQLGDGFEKRLQRVLAHRGPELESIDVHQMASEFLASGRVAQTHSTLDQFRLVCKRLRYTAELAPESPLQRLLARKLIKVQDACGEWHDTVKLAALAEELLGSTYPVSSMLRARRTSTFNEALRILPDCLQDVMKEASRSLPEYPTAIEVTDGKSAAAAA